MLDIAVTSHPNSKMSKFVIEYFEIISTKISILKKLILILIT